MPLAIYVEVGQREHQRVGVRGLGSLWWVVGTARQQRGGDQSSGREGGKVEHALPQGNPFNGVEAGGSRVCGGGSIGKRNQAEKGKTPRGGAFFAGWESSMPWHDAERLEFSAHIGSIVVVQSQLQPHACRLLAKPARCADVVCQGNLLPGPLLQCLLALA